MLGLGSPASVGGVKEGDVLVTVQDTLVTLMKHSQVLRNSICEYVSNFTKMFTTQVVDLIKSVKANTLTLTVERGELVVPNIADCFPITSETENMTEEERRLYYQEAMRQGLGSRLIPKHFTTVGKMKVHKFFISCIIIFLAAH